MIKLLNATVLFHLKTTDSKKELDDKSAFEELKLSITLEILITKSVIFVFEKGFFLRDMLISLTPEG